MGKLSKRAAQRGANSKVVEFVDVAAAGDVRAVKKLIKSGKVEIDDDVNGVTALMKACGNGHLPVVVELLDNGAGMWCAGPMDDPKTPFMWAAHHGQLGVIRYFVEEVGLDDLAMNKGAGKSGRKTAMDYALDAGNNLGEEARDKKAQVLAYLQENAAEHGEGVTDPETVFEGAVRGDVNYVHFCLEANGEIITSAHGVEGSSLLHVAGNTGNVDLAKNLVSHGAKVDARDALDRTPLMSAAMAGNVEVLRMLLGNGATLEHRDSNGNTALHHACEAGHLECVRALLSREAASATPGTADAAAVAAILEGMASEYAPPAKLLSPSELLLMKNKGGYTPVMKAFAGGVHISVIRYVVGILDRNVDAVRCGQVDAEPPSLLSRLLCTDGIVLQPPPPPREGEAPEGKTGGGVGGLFTCRDDGAEEDASKTEVNVADLEENKEEERIAEAMDSLRYPVRVPPGPPSHGHRRMARFIDNMRTSVWGYDPSKVYVMSRPAVIAQKQMITFQEAQEKKLLLPLSSISPAATLLYVSHRWVGVGQPDAQDASTQMQLRRYLEEHAGQGIHYVWLDVSCINVEDKEEASYEQYVSNVVTVLMRCTHLLAVPPCRTLDPRTLVRDMAVARMAEKNAAVGEHPEYLKKVPSTLSMNLPADGGSISFVTNASGLNVPSSVAAASAAAGGASASAAGGGRGVGVSKTTGKRRVSTEAVIAQAVEQEVDAAIVERKAAHLDKWSALLISPDTAAGGEGEGIEIGGVPAEGGHASLAVAGGGGKAHKPSHATANGGHASVGAGKGGGVAAPPSSTGVGAGGGGSSSRFVSSDRKQKKRSLAGSGKKRSALEGVSDLSGVVEGGGEVVLMTKKEKRALLAEQARSDAKAAAAEVTHDLDQMPTVLKNGVLYSDPVSLLNRGWVEMEVSLALVFGVQVLVCARWGPKVTFQTVLVKSIMSDDGETEEQGPGFKGAFLHGLERIAPDVEETKGFVEGVKKVFGGSERPPDPTVPVKVMYAPMLELCHEPQTVVTPLVRASLALHNEGALLAFLSGELSPVNMMHRLSGLALQDVKDGFSGLGPLSDEKDRVRLVRLYLMGLSYAMGVVPKGKKAVGKPKWQLVKDNAEAQRKIDSLQREVESLKDRTAPAPVPDPKSDAPPAAPSAPGCGCVVM